MPTPAEAFEAWWHSHLKHDLGSHKMTAYRAYQEGARERQEQHCCAEMQRVAHLLGEDPQHPWKFCPWCATPRVTEPEPPHGT